MAEREASIKLTLDGADFTGTLRRVGDDIDRGTKKLTAMERGLKGAGSAMKSLGGMAGKALGLVTGLAGGLSFASGIKGAIELDSKYKQLAFRIRTATGEMMSSNDVQRVAERAAAKTGRKTGEMADTFSALFQATGDSKFAADALDAIGTTAMATGESVETLTALADQLHTKFGIAADELMGSFGKIFESASGAASVEEVSAKIGDIGAEMIQAGMGGKAGFEFMMAALRGTDDNMGGVAKQTKGLKQMLLSLTDDAQIKGLAKALSINPNVLLNEKDVMGRMRKILSMGKKGVAAIRASMGEAEEQKALDVLFVNPFEKALAEATAGGLKGQAAIDAALVIMENGFKALGKTTTDEDTLRQEAVERMKDPQNRLIMALDRIETSFSKPEITEALNTLADDLPAIASAFGKFASFVVENPILSGALGIGGKAALGFLQGAAEPIVKAHVAGAVKWAVAQVAVPIKLIAGHVAGGAAASAKVLAAHVAGGGIVGGALKGGGVLAAAAIGVAVGKALAEGAFAGQDKAQGEAAVAVAGAGSSRGGIQGKRAQIEQLRKASKQLQESQSGVSGVAQDVFGWGARMVDSEAPNLRAQNDKQIAEMEALIRQKEGEIVALERGGPATTVASDSAGKPGKSVATLDAAGQRATGKAVAEGLKGTKITVHVANMPGAAGSAGPGGSRGPSKPAHSGMGGGV